jgi:hypothetical protein
MIGKRNRKYSAKACHFGDQKSRIN